MPWSYDHSEAWRGEALHLVTEADDNQDNFLTRKEILDNYEILVGSQATDFGKSLTLHDEF